MPFVVKAALGSEAKAEVLFLQREDLVIGARTSAFRARYSSSLRTTPRSATRPSSISFSVPSKLTKQEVRHDNPSGIPLRNLWACQQYPKSLVFDSMQ